MVQETALPLRQGRFFVARGLRRVVSRAEARIGLYKFGKVVANSVLAGQFTSHDFSPAFFIQTLFLT